MKRFRCRHCGNEVYFGSTTCVGCGRQLGYEPVSAEMLAATADGQWSDGRIGYGICANADASACNWLVPTMESTPFCKACGHNRTIPDLSDPDGLDAWRALEGAKRMLFYSILRWKLPCPTQRTDPDTGLAFDFLADVQHSDGTLTPVMTGHDNGLITINIAEADDAERERRRAQMGEPYRTLLGHFRHEVGHYFWDRLVRDARRLEDFRVVFGDERQDYAKALHRHYEAGPEEDWSSRYISYYAAAHPWEDWAETFAHYIHIVDALETAAAFGLRTRGVVTRANPADFDPYVAGTIDEILDAWVPVTIAINAINRSMGQPDLYPFVMNEAVNQKFAFIHDLMRANIDRPR